MKHGRKRIVGFFVGLTLAAMGVPAVSFGVGNNPQWGQDISMVHIWSGGFSCSGTKISPYHVLTAAHCYKGSNVGVVITSNSGMRIWDSNSTKLYHRGGNIASWSLYPDGRDFALITTKTPLSGAVANVVNADTILNQIPSMQVTACGIRLVDPNTGQPISETNNASCATASSTRVYSKYSKEVELNWPNNQVPPIYHGDSGGGVYANGNLISVISTTETISDGRTGKYISSRALEPLIDSAVYSWLQAHGVPLSNQQPQQPKPQGIQVDKSRIGGANRVGTSLLLLDKAHNKSEVVLATGRNFPDGLVAGALAGASKSGVVLTMGTNAIEPETLSKLKAVGTSKVTIVGGTGAVSQGVEDSLKTAGIQVERIAGTDRYDTAFKVYEHMKASGKLKLNARGEPYGVFVATGKDFPDALAASAVAAKIGTAVILADTPEQVNRVAGAQPYAVGAQTSSLMANMGVSMSGWFDGEDRYDTANKLVNWSVWRGGDTVMVAVGTNFADALAAGPLAASTGQLLVLANPSSAVLKVPAGVKNLVFIGGEGANPDKYAVVN